METRVLVAINNIHLPLAEGIVYRLQAKFPLMRFALTFALTSDGPTTAIWLLNVPDLPFLRIEIMYYTDGILDGMNLVKSYEETQILRRN